MLTIVGDDFDPIILPDTDTTERYEYLERSSGAIHTSRLCRDRCQQRRRMRRLPFFVVFRGEGVVVEGKLAIQKKIDGAEVSLSMW